MYIQHPGESSPEPVVDSLAFRDISRLHPHSSIFLLLPFGAGSSGVRE